MKKYCKSCGFENASEDKFCVNCGAKLEEIKQQPVKKVEPVVSHPKTPVPKTSKTPMPMNKIFLVLTIIALILAVVAIVVALVITPGGTPSAGSVTSNELANDAVTSGKILDGTIADDDISSLGISKITADSIISSMIQDNTITYDDLTNDVVDSITGAVNISNNSITTDKIKNGTIQTVDLDDDCVTSAKIASDAIGATKIAAGSVGASEIATDGVTSSEIAADAVGTTEIANDAVTYAKMAMKIKYGQAANVVNGSSVSHSIGSTPAAVVVTPEFDSSVASANYSIIANVYDLGPNTFKVTLYIQLDGDSALQEIDGTTWSAVDLFWIAID
jgi:hypothetical protein